MAQVRERPTTGTNRDAPGGTGTSPAGFIERARATLFPPRRFVDASTRTVGGNGASGSANGKTAGRAADAAADDQRTRQRTAQRGDMMKMMRGLLAYVVGSIVIQYGLVFLDDQVLHQYLQKHVQTLFPTSWPLVGAMTWYALIYILLLIALVWGLYRFNVMPKAFASSQASRTPPPPPSATIGRGKTAQKRAAAAANSNGKATTARSATPPARAAAASESDAAYDRVRALQQRARKRKR